MNDRVFIFSPICVNTRGRGGEQTGNRRGTHGEQAGNTRGTGGEQSGNTRGTGYLTRVIRLILEVNNIVEFAYYYS